MNELDHEVEFGGHPVAEVGSRGRPLPGRRHPPQNHRATQPEPHRGRTRLVVRPLTNRISTPWLWKAG